MDTDTQESRTVEVPAVKIGDKVNYQYSDGRRSFGFVTAIHEPGNVNLLVAASHGFEPFTSVQHGEAPGHWNTHLT